MTPYKSLNISQAYISEQLGEQIAFDPIVCSNLFMCYNNARLTGGIQEWNLFLAHICWPEENEFPEHMFMVSKAHVPGYTRLMNRIEELYNE